MQEIEKENILEVPQKKKKNKAIIFIIIGIIVVILAILAILGYAYFTVNNNLPSANLTNNNSAINSPDNNLLVPNATGINGTTPATNKTQNKTQPPGGGGDGIGGTTPPPASCTSDTGCSSAGSFCEGSTPYNCTLGADGCLKRANREVCPVGDYCYNGDCLAYSYNDKIRINSPKGNVWNKSRDVEFNITFNESLPAYGFIDWENSLVAWWRGEGNASDESGKNNNGLIEGNTSYVTGKFGKAFSFDGDGGDIYFSDSSFYQFSGSFTVSVWVYNKKSPDGSVDEIIYTDLWRLYYDGNQGAGWVFSGVSYKDPHPENKWVHIVGVFDSEKRTASLYLNGSWVSTVNTGFNTINYPNTRFRIGAASNVGSENMDGLIDEVMLFNRALNEGEIKALYNAKDQGLVTTFKNLDEYLTEYSYNIYSVDAVGSKSDSGKHNLIIDTPNSAPKVTLQYPLNHTRSNSTMLEFNCSAMNTNYNTQLANVTFYWYFNGNFWAEETKTVSGDFDSRIFTKSGLTEGNITWNCYICDTNGNCGFAENNNTLLIGQSEYYVSTSGDDNNPGTLAQPFKTIQKCADIAIAGDTCYMRGGTYRETVTPKNSGNAYARITFKAYPGEKITVSGADLLTAGWVQHSDSIYKTSGMNWDLGKGKNQIFVNGKVMMEARWPNANDVMLPVLASASGMNCSVVGNILTLRDGDLKGFPENYWVGCTAHGIWGQRYHAATAEITTSINDGEYGHFIGTLDTSNRGNPNDGMYYITGCYNALDNETEWFYDNKTNTLYLWAPNNDNPGNYIVEAKKRQQAFNLNSKSYISINDINIFASNIVTDESSHNIIINNINAIYVSHYTLIDEGDMGEGQKGVRDTGIILDGHDNIIKNSEIAYSAGNGVSLIGNNNEINNCSIHDVNYAVTECAAVSTGYIEAKNIITRNNRIVNNVLYNTGRGIINHCQAENISILYNEMYNNRRGEEPWDLGATYAIMTDGKGSEIAYNYIHDIRSIGIYLDNLNYNFKVHHNVIWGISYTSRKNAIHMNNPSINHSIYQNTVDGYISMGYSSTMNGTEIKNNICYGLYGEFPNATIENNTQLSVIDPHSIFVDYDNKNFHLKAGSPAIDAGQDLGYTHDFEGNLIPYGIAPDIGAYEYQGSSLPSESPHLSFASQIYKGFKGLLTENTIKEITGYFFRRQG